MKSGILYIIFTSGFVVVTFGFAFHFWQQKRHILSSIWFALMLVCLVAGAFFYGLSNQIPAKLFPKETPFVKVNSVQLDTVAAGKPPLVLIEVENGPIPSIVNFTSISYVFTPFVPETYLRYQSDSPPQTIVLAPHQIITVRWRWDGRLFTDEQIKSLSDQPPTAEAFFFARATYSDKRGVHPFFPSCWKYDTGFPNHLANCHDDLKFQ